MKLQFITSIATPYGNAEEWIDTENENMPVFIVDRSTAHKQVTLKPRTVTYFDPVERKYKTGKADSNAHNFLILNDWEFSDLICGDCDNDPDLTMTTLANVSELCKWINQNS